MSNIKPKQLYGVPSTLDTGSIFWSGSLVGANGSWSISSDGTIYATALSGSLDTGWVKSGSVLTTSDIFTVKISGSFNVSGDATDIFTVTDMSGSSLFKVSSNGVIAFAVHDADPSGSAELGGMYFTSSSLFIGIQE